MVWVKEEEEKGEGGINNSSQWINKVKMIFCFTSFWGNKVPTAEMFFVYAIVSGCHFFFVLFVSFTLQKARFKEKMVKCLSCKFHEDYRDLNSSLHSRQALFSW